MLPSWLMMATDLIDELDDNSLFQRNLSDNPDIQDYVMDPSSPTDAEIALYLLCKCILCI